MKASYNNVNRLLSQDPGGTLRFAGTLNEAAAVTIQSKAAAVATDNTFTGTTTISSGTSSIQVKATDYSGNLRTNTYDVTAAGGTKTFTHDSNGNLTGDGTRTFEWDAEDRLLAVNNGTHRSEFTYDGFSRRVRIVEKDNSIITNDARFLWCSEEICEERDSTGATVTKRFFPQGEQQGTSNLFYTRDHLGSIRELMDNTGAVRAGYSYDAFGRRSKISGDLDTDLGYTGYKIHAPSELVLTLYRVYDSNLGRWLSEDPLRLDGGMDFYTYVLNDPVKNVDPFGLKTRVIITFDPIKFNGKPITKAITYGSHAALFIDNGDEPLIYDPAGGYSGDHQCGGGDACYGFNADLNKYRKYAEKLGSTVQMFVFDTTSEEEKQIAERVAEIGGATGGFCALNVASAIKGIGPFEKLKLSWRPGQFANQLRDIPRRLHSFGVSGAW